MAERILNLTYFKAPISHTLLYPGESPDIRKCACCGKESENTFYYCPSDAQELYGCIDCLIAKKFSIAKDTEIGEVVDGQLQEKIATKEPDMEYALSLENHEMADYIMSFDDEYEVKILKPPKGFNVESLKEICSTPDVATYQQFTHLCHCNDFMAYVGRWDPVDFDKHAPGGNGRALWMSAIEDDNLDYLWDRTLEDKKEEGDEWPLYEDCDWSLGAGVYVFQCLHCDKIRAYWDCD